jgi:branched-chain amino acid transport system substrate-binding protein
MRFTSRFTAIAAVGLMAVAGTSACSSSGGGGSSGSGSGSGSVISLQVDTNMTPEALLGGVAYPEPYQGAQAAAAAINKAGGINGHKVQVSVCDTQADPNQSALCARKAVSNHVVAVVGSWDPLGAGEVLPILQAANIPYIGALAGEPVELQNPVSFIFDPGALLATYAVAETWIDEGCKNVVEWVDPATSTSYTVTQQKILAPANVKLNLVNIDQSKPDVSAPLSTGLSKNPDCASYIGSAATDVSLIKGMRQAGSKAKFITAVGSLIPQVLASSGTVANGTIAINTTLDPVSSTDPLVKEFRSDVTAFTGASSASSVFNEYGQDGWSSVRLVKLAFQGAGGSDLTGSYLIKKLGTMCSVNVGNVYPNVDFCKPIANVSGMSRIYNATERYYVAENGKYQPLDNTWHSFASALKSVGTAS